MTPVRSNFLRRALTIDAVVSGVTALLLVLAGTKLARWLDVPEALPRYAAIVLVPFVIYVGILARREVVPRASVVAVIAMNIAWVVASVWLVMGGAIRPNALGYAFIIGQALAVALFAELQYVGLRRAAPRTAAT
jgi:hypothetical protein